ncbi:MAG TPA: bifunctional serine/threonine-protein kinase/formylglycine-generating enzyme family protein [Pyrinomonadaceae bacterium]
MADSWKQIREIFDAASRVRPEDRAEFLDRACNGSEDIRREVESLLSSLDSAESFLETPAVADMADALDPPALELENGRSFAHYEIIRRIGEGGMGVVYLGRDTRLDRRVAIKLLNTRFERNADNIRRFIQEAKAASALNHPNILTIFEIGEIEGSHYIVSEYIEGRTLRDLMKSEKIELRRIVDIVGQIADALAAAHKARIVHRDIKPENIIVRDDGYVKVVDFGLAKLIPENVSGVWAQGLQHQNSTASGMILGTVNYMSPEQAKGQRVDQRTDIFSLGVVLYEMIARKRPFEGDSAAESFANLINKQPESVEADGSPALAELQRILTKMLRKDREARHQTMQEVAADLRETRGGDFSNPVFEQQTKAALYTQSPTVLMPQTTAGGANTTEETSAIYAAWHQRWRVEGAIVLLLAIAAGGYLMWHRSNLNWAKSQVARVQEFARADKYFEAFDLASQVQDYLPGDPTLMAVMPSISDTLTVNSEPAGAQVYLKRYQADENGLFPERRAIGITPITSLRIPKGPQIVYLEKEGYAPVQTVISNRLIRFGNNLVWNPTSSVEISRKLIEAGALPDKMIFVPGGEYRLASSMRPTDDKIKLDDYFIDKYEVSNKDYKEFVSFGGYARQEYWKVPIVKDGRTLSWNEAMSLFHDRTSLPGPREWSNQEFPAGKADHPVTGITWYEAAAYAEFKQKKLPTVFQWEKAARNGTHLDASYKMPWGDLFPGDSIKYRANFDNNGTVPVDSEEFGISEFGAFNMAGNVSEWVLNQGPDGHFATGGAWGEPIYTFSYFGNYPDLFASPKRGFRCVRLVASDQASSDQGGAKLQKDLPVPNYPRTTEAQFRELAGFYDYAKTPLDGEVIESTETADWRREKITFNGAVGERAIAYLYLPHNAAPPLQVIQMLAGSDVDNGVTPVPLLAEEWMGSVMKSGRALLAVVVKGNSERPWPPNYQRPRYESAEWHDLLVNRFTDHRRGLDYLETRDDIDMSRVGFVGISSGASTGLILAAVESRYRSIFLTAGGLPAYFMTNQPAANPINFAPHVKPPKHILNGRFDENYPGKTALEPMLKLFSEPKEVEIYEGPHAPPIEVLVPAMNKFFDKTLGPVRRQ